MNDSRSNPADPVFLLAGLRLHVVCNCGRSTKPRIGELAVRHWVPSVTPLQRVIARLRCSRCGDKPVVAEPVHSLAG